MELIIATFFDILGAAIVIFIKHFGFKKDEIKKNDKQFIIKGFVLFNIYVDVLAIFTISWLTVIYLQNKKLSPFILTAIFAYNIVLSILYQYYSKKYTSPQFLPYWEQIKNSAKMIKLRKMNSVINMIFSGSILLVSLTTSNTALLNNAFLLTVGITIVSYNIAIRINK